MTYTKDELDAEWQAVEAEAADLKRRANVLRDESDVILTAKLAHSEQQVRQARKDREMAHRMTERAYQLDDVAYNIKNRARSMR